MIIPVIFKLSSKRKFAVYTCSEAINYFFYFTDNQKYYGVLIDNATKILKARVRESYGGSVSIAQKQDHRPVVMWLGNSAVFFIPIGNIF